MISIPLLDHRIETQHLIDSLPPNSKRELDIQRIRLGAASMYGSSAVECLNRGDYYSAKLFAVEAWYYASLACQ